MAFACYEKNQFATDLALNATLSFPLFGGNDLTSHLQVHDVLSYNYRMKSLIILNQDYALQRILTIDGIEDYLSVQDGR